MLSNNYIRNFRGVLVRKRAKSTDLQNPYVPRTSFLLTSVFLWAICNDKKCKAAAPTGIAAANIEIENTHVGSRLTNPIVLWG